MSWEPSERKAKKRGMGSERPYDIVLLGATGYTGALTAEHIAEHLPTTLKWAIAGRSRNKLEKLAEDLKRINPDRVQPGSSHPSVLARKSKLRSLQKLKLCS